MKRISWLLVFLIALPVAAQTVEIEQIGWSPADTGADSTSCLAGDVFPCDIPGLDECGMPVLYGSGNSSGLGGGARIQWSGVDDGGGEPYVNVRLVNGNEVSAWFKFTPSSSYEAWLSRARAMEWLSWHDAEFSQLGPNGVFTYPGTGPECEDCPACVCDSVTEEDAGGIVSPFN